MRPHICTCGYRPRDFRRTSTWEIPCTCGHVYEAREMESVCPRCRRINCVGRLRREGKQLPAELVKPGGWKPERGA